MKIIKVYDKNFAQLTTFTEQDFNNLVHQRTQGEIGDCSFMVDAKGLKISEANINLYNRVRIYDDGVAVFTGVITQKNINLNTVNIRCRELPFILKKRVTLANYTLSGTITDVLTTLLTDINAIEDTGISIGTLAGVGSVNLTFNRSDVWTVIKQICESTGNQFQIDTNGKLNVAVSLGLDLSASVFFRYDINQITNANIFTFEIEDDGDSIFTLAHGVSQGFTSDQPNTGLIAQYGLLENFKDFRVVNSQPVLDQFTTLEIADRIYSPKITLKPNVVDNFSIFDLVRIKLRNSLVNIDDSFQVIQKKVKYVGDQKTIELRINNLPNYLVKKLADRDKRLTLLEKEL